MYALSAEAAAALRQSHTVDSIVEVYDAGELIGTLPVLAGGVTVDATAAIRRSLDVTVVDDDGSWLPVTETSALTPYGNEVRPYRGILLPSGDVEYVPLGVFGISAANVTDTGNGVTIQVQGYDRARRVQRARWTDPYVIAAGTNYATAIQDLIANRLPGTIFSFMLTTRTTPLLVLGVERDHDPWKLAQEMAAALGAELFFDADGVCVLRPEPDPATAPVSWSYAEGEEAMILGVKRSLSDEGAYNHVVVTGESTSNTAPVRGEARDEDPASPTYYLGDFGDVPFFVTSRYVTSSAMAVDAAEALLLRVRSLTERVSFPSIVNPAHEGSDVVTVVRAEAGVDDLYVLESFTIPLGATQAMEATTRKRRT